MPIAEIGDRKSGAADLGEKCPLTANACGFGSAGSVDERRLFEADLVVLAAGTPEANAKREQHRVLKAGLSTTLRSPAGPNA